ncbi:MAG: aspartate--ammonia ligase, partial [Clostridia bacterium]
SGLYTDMNAIRRDEVCDEVHSLYVDQWDWERVICAEERNINFLKEIVTKIYSAIYNTARMISKIYPQIINELPKEIFFVTSQQMEDRYPSMTPQEREYAYCKEYGAIFVIGIGDFLRSGERHDNRAPDYDDWSMNGDILLYYPLLDRAIELSSMGIRVDKETMLAQLEKRNLLERVSLPFHKELLAGNLPLTIGGGIGQSRLCMILLQKAHIGEVQNSVWPESEIKDCKKRNIFLL